MGRRDAGEADDVSRARADVDLYGWALQYVEADDPHEAFGYTAGLSMRGLPELVVRGLAPEDTWAVLNDLAEDCTSGRLPEPGEELTGMVPGVTLAVRELTDTSCLPLAHAIVGGEIRALLLERQVVPVGRA